MQRTIARALGVATLGAAAYLALGATPAPVTPAALGATPAPASAPVSARASAAVTPAVMVTQAPAMPPEIGERQHGDGDHAGFRRGRWGRMFAWCIT